MRGRSGAAYGGRVLTLRPLYPNLYVWFVFLSAMDVIMTFLVLYFGGTEANSLANWILQRFGLPGMTLFKFAMVTFVIALCEIAGRLNERAGRLLITAGIIVTCIPVVLAFSLLIVHL